MSNELNRNAYVFRMDSRLDIGLEENVIGLGWRDANLQDAKEDNWEGLKYIILESDDYYEDKPRALGMAAGSIWRFIFEIKKSDLCVVPSSSGFYVAEVLEDRIHRDDSGFELDFIWRKKVKWLNDKKPIPRNFANNLLQMRMKARQTCVNASDLVKEIQDCLERKNALDLTSTILEKSYDIVADALMTTVNDCGLEEVVRRLAEASGAVEAHIPPKNSSLTGDADVIAVYNLNIANQESAVQVIYQVKQHDDISDHLGVQQLIDRMKVSENSPPQTIKACLVTTANSVTTQAQELADSNDIIVITKKGLVEWIMMLGLKAIKSQ